jgi:hypothetical protein
VTKTMLGLSAPTRPVIVTRARTVSETVRRDPFRGEPVGDSRDSRRCVVMGIRTSRLELVRQHSDENDAHNAQLEHLRTERAIAIGAGNHVEAARLARQIAGML